jgi:hypothetical protein
LQGCARHALRFRNLDGGTELLAHLRALYQQT